MSYDRICTSNVPVVRINGNTIWVGALLIPPKMHFLGARIWCSRARTVSFVKHCLGWLGLSCTACVTIGSFVRDFDHRTVGFVGTRAYFPMAAFGRPLENMIKIGPGAYKSDHTMIKIIHLAPNSDVCNAAQPQSAHLLYYKITSTSSPAPNSCS